MSQKKPFSSLVYYLGQFGTLIQIWFSQTIRDKSQNSIKTRENPHDLYCLFSDLPACHNPEESRYWMTSLSLYCQHPVHNFLKHFSNFVDRRILIWRTAKSYILEKCYWKENPRTCLWLHKYLRHGEIQRLVAHTLAHLRQGHTFCCCVEDFEGRDKYGFSESGAQNQPFFDYITCLNCRKIGHWRFCQVQEPPMVLVAKCQQHLADLISQNLSKIWPTIWFCTSLVIINCFPRQTREQILLNLDESPLSSLTSHGLFQGTNRWFSLFTPTVLGDLGICLEDQWVSSFSWQSPGVKDHLPGGFACHTSLHSSPLMRQAVWSKKGGSKAVHHVYSHLFTNSENGEGFIIWLWRHKG